MKTQAVTHFPQVAQITAATIFLACRWRHLSTLFEKAAVTGNVESNAHAHRKIDYVSFSSSSLITKKLTFPLPLLPAVFLFFQEI